MQQKHIFPIYTFSDILLAYTIQLFSHSLSLICDNCLSLQFRNFIYAYVFFPTYLNCINIYIDRVTYHRQGENFPEVAYCLLDRLTFFSEISSRYFHKKRWSADFLGEKANLFSYDFIFRLWNLNHFCLCVSHVWIFVNNAS